MTYFNKQLKTGLSDMKAGDFKFINGRWGIVKERKGYAVMFGDDECFAYVLGYVSRNQAKKEIKRIVNNTL